MRELTAWVSDERSHGRCVMWEKHFKIWHVNVSGVALESEKLERNQKEFERCFIMDYKLNQLWWSSRDKAQVSLSPLWLWPSAFHAPSCWNWFGHVRPTFVLGLSSYTSQISWYLSTVADLLCGTAPPLPSGSHIYWVKFTWQEETSHYSSTLTINPFICNPPYTTFSKGIYSN